jgi:3-oxoacyl-[acyl-carrier protein] reductase
VLVTGSSSGIGRATAVLLSRLGARVILVSRREPQLRETLAALEGSGHGIEPFDLLNTAEIPAWLAKIGPAYGPFHGLVHAAGMLSSKPLRFLEQNDWSDTLRLNLDSAFALAKGFRQRSVCASPSSIVFFSSVAALVGSPGKSAYAASKGGIISLTRALAVELACERIRVNCVAPGWVETEMTALDSQTMTPEQLEALRQRHLLGFGRPEDVAHAVAFMLADTGRWMTGTTLVVDGGFSIR